MKPMIILPPDVMDAENIKLLRENDICVVVAKDPVKVRFVDPIPAASSRTEIEEVAIELFRRLIAWPWSDAHISRGYIMRLYCEILAESGYIDQRTKKKLEKEKTK
jgi:hypothetical protein